MIFLTIVYLLVLLLFLLIACIHFYAAFDDGILVVPGIFMIFIAMILFGGPILSHNSDIILIRNSNKIIDINEEAVDRLDNQIKLIIAQDTKQAIMNGDTPIKSMVEAQSEYISKIVKVKERVLNSKMNVEERRIGFTAYAIWIMGDK
jgi:hypothetical protein